jgi:hypothetical protein
MEFLFPESQGRKIPWNFCSQSPRGAKFHGISVHRVPGAQNSAEFLLPESQSREIHSVFRIYSVECFFVLKPQGEMYITGGKVALASADQYIPCSWQAGNATASCLPCELLIINIDERLPA